MILAIEEQRDPYTVMYAMKALSSGIGSAMCLPALQRACEYRTKDIQIQAMYAVERFAGNAALPFYRMMLQSRAHAEKYAAYDAMLKHGDETDIPLMATHLRRVLARKRRRGWAEADTILFFLEQFVGYSAEADRAMAWARTRLDLAGESEKRAIVRRVRFLNESKSRPWVLVIRPDTLDGRRVFGTLFQAFPALGFATVMLGCRQADVRAQRLAFATDFVISIGDAAAALIAAARLNFPEERTLRLPRPAYARRRFANNAEFLPIARQEEEELLLQVREALAVLGSTESDSEL